MKGIIHLTKLAFSKKPVEIIFPVTFMCNSRCKMCSRWKIDTSKEELTTQQIKKIFKQLKDFGVLIINITGGEPLLRKDIFKILDICESLGLKVVFTTNGIALNEEKIKKLIKYKNLELIISLDTLNKKTYKQLRGVDAFDKVIKNIKLVKKINPDYPLRIHAVFSKINVNDFDDLVNFSKQNKLRLSAMPYNYEMRYEKKDNSIMYQNSELIPIFKKLSEMTHLPYISGFKIIYKKAIDWLQGKKIGRCNAGREILYMHHNGKIAICGEFPIIFDLKKQNIVDVYDPKIAKKAKGCQKCFLGCYWGFALIKQNKFAVIKELLFSKKVIKLLTKTQF